MPIRLSICKTPVYGDPVRAICSIHENIKYTKFRVPVSLMTIVMENVELCHKLKLSNPYIFAI